MEPTHEQQPQVASQQAESVNKPRSRMGPEILVAALLVLVLVGTTAYFGLPHGDTPVAAPEPLLAFDVFQHPESNPSQSHPLADKDVVHPTDGFTFAVHNRTPQPTWFMIFGMDSSDTMYWFFPQADPQKRNASLPLGLIPSAVLPEGVTPNGAHPGVFRIVGLFTPEAVNIALVEDAYKTAGPKGLAQALGAEMQVVSVELE